MKRKGYGIGKGMGYKNLMPMDSHIHSLSAKGVKTYMKELKLEMGKVKRYQKQQDLFRKKIESSYDVQEKATKTLEKKLKVATKPYIAERNKLDKQEKTASQKEYDAQTKVKELENQIALTKAKSGKEHNVESVESFLRLIDFGYANLENNVYEKPKLKNGIQIFKGQEWEVTRDSWGSEGNAGKQMWLAFMDGRLVGYSLRRASEHQGDSTTGISFIGTNQLKKREKYSYSEKYYMNDRVGYTDWVKELKKIKNPKKLKTVSLKNKGQELQRLF